LSVPLPTDWFFYLCPWPFDRVFLFYLCLIISLHFIEFFFLKPPFILPANLFFDFFPNLVIAAYQYRFCQYHLLFFEHSGGLFSVYCIVFQVSCIFLTKKYDFFQASFFRDQDFQVTIDFVLSLLSIRWLSFSNFKWFVYWLQ